MQQEEINWLRQLWAEGIASGPGHLGDIDQVKAEARRRQDRSKSGAETSATR